MRVDLRDGQWADLRERITHGQAKALKVALRRARAEDEAAVEFDTALVRTFLRSWSVNDVDGNPITVEQVDSAPEDIVDDLVQAAIPLWTGATVPNAPTPTSSDGS